MIRSMTGYGKATGSIGDNSYVAEIRSLNSKQLNLRLQLPPRFKEKEIELRSFIAQRIPRGKVDLTVSEASGEAEQEYRINGEVLKAHYRELKAHAGSLGAEKSDLIQAAMRIPDTLRYESPEPDPSELESLHVLLEKCLGEFDAFTEKEGEAMRKDLKEQSEGIRNGLARVEGYEEERRERVKERLNKRVKEVIPPEELDEKRFEQELLYYLERLDINEEKTRLQSHLEQFEQTLSGEGSGKKLQFISQEMGREINTIGSKADHAAIQEEVVDMKDRLERIKEQIMNVR